MAPLSTGIPHSASVTYVSEDGNTNTTGIGGLIEPFSFGGSMPSDALGFLNSGMLNVPLPEKHFTLSRAIAISSMAGASIFAEEKKSDLAQIEVSAQFLTHFSFAVSQMVLCASNHPGGNLAHFWTWCVDNHACGGRGDFGQLGNYVYVAAGVDENFHQCNV